MKATCWKIVSLCLAALFVSTITFAEPFSLDKDLRTTKLTLKDDPDREGFQWTAARGLLEGTTDHLHVDGLNPKRVALAQLVSVNSDNPVRLTVVKDLWTESGRSCDTGPEGVCDVKFRTSGDAGFKIDGNPGAMWHLLLLISPEIPVDVLMPSPIFDARKVDATKYEGGSAASLVLTDGTIGASESSAASQSSTGNGPSLLVWIGAVGVALLAVIAILLAKSIRNKADQSASSLLPLLLLSSLVSVSALSAAPAIAATESDAGSIDVDLTELNSEIDQEVSDRAKAKKRIEDVAKNTQTALKILADARRAYSTWFGDLSNCATVANPAGTPRIPSFCEGNVNCKACYADARTQFNEVRGTFEQLRIIYSCNKRAIDAAIKFGDSASGVHGVTGMAWQAIKLDIESSVTKMKKAYDDKYLELSERLHDSMIEIATCEAYYGEPDWYDRFGYVYFEFMQDKYKRSD